MQLVKAEQLLKIKAIPWHTGASATASIVPPSIVEFLVKPIYSLI